MPSWKNATREAVGVLRPEEVEQHTDLSRDHTISAELEPYVERYWTLRWDRSGQPPYRAEVLSDPCVNLSVEEGSHPRFGFALPAALVHGVVTRRFSVDLHGTGAVTAAKFRPGGFAAFAGILPPRISVVQLGGELPLAPSAVLQAVLSEGEDAARAQALDACLRPLAREPAPAYLELLAILNRMRCDRGLVRVDQVAAGNAMTVRALQRLFSTYVGVGVKAVLARYRLQDAVATIDAGGVEQLADLAVELGWFDQAHFSSEFRSVVGVTPSAYLQRVRAGGGAAAH